jgi:hypothetical protein
MCIHMEAWTYVYREHGERDRGQMHVRVLIGRPPPKNTHM